MKKTGIFANVSPVEKSLGILLILSIIGSMSVWFSGGRGNYLGYGILMGVPLSLGGGLIFSRMELSKVGWKSAIFLFLSAVIITVGYYLWHSGVLVDDAGFIIRYLKQSEEGCWYCFNADEGPVYGISSFSHGAFTLIIYKLGLGLPETCLRISNAAGFLLSSWLLLKILNKWIAEKALVIPISFGILWGAKSWMMIAATGMETPLHVAIVLAALHSLASSKNKPFWFWISLSVVSKLDAVPIALAWGALLLFQNSRNWFSRKNNPIIEALIWAGIPIGIWILFSSWYFGSPLPHSAGAKLEYHRSAMQHWFPFLERYLTGDWLRLLLATFLTSWALHLILRFRTKLGHFTETAPGFAVGGLFFLYYFYNPAERMEWYYALPDILIVLQTVISLYILFSFFFSSFLKWIPALASLGFVTLCLLDSAQGMRFFNQYLKSLEGERWNIGKFVASRTQKGDTLLAAHGLPSAWSDAHVLDITGINSEQGIALQANVGRAIRETHPGYIILNSFSYYMDELRALPYSIDSIFYEIAEIGMGPWVFLERNKGNSYFNMKFLSAEDFQHCQQAKTEGNIVKLISKEAEWIAKNSDSLSHFLRVGIRRDEKTAMRVTASEYWKDSLIRENIFSIPQFESTTKRNYSWTGLKIPVDGMYGHKEGYRIRFIEGSGKELTFYHPMLTGD